jgi:hypothetical protein
LLCHASFRCWGMSCTHVSWPLHRVSLLGGKWCLYPVCIKSLWWFQFSLTRWIHLPYFPAYSVCVIYTKRSEIVKNEHARYTVERFPTDNARVICKKNVLENTVLCIKHNFQLKLVCSIHSVALLNITLFKSNKFFIGLYIERINRA